MRVDTAPYTLAFWRSEGRTALIYVASGRRASMSGTSLPGGAQALLAVALVVVVVLSGAAAAAPRGSVHPATNLISTLPTGAVTVSPARAPAGATPKLPPDEIYGVEATVPAGLTPVGVAFDSGNGDIYVTDSQGGNVTVINGSTEKDVANVTVGANPAGVVYDSGTNRVYVVNSFGNSVSVISSTNVVTATFAVPSEPAGIAYDSASGDLYVTQEGANSTSVYQPGDTSAPIATIHVGLQPIAAVYDPGNTEVYVANSNSSNVSAINTTTNTVVASIPVGQGPLGLAYDSGQDELFVANDDSNNTTIISTTNNTVIGSVNVGTHPAGAAYNPQLGIVAVSDEHSDNVSVILDSNDSVVATVPVGEAPVGVAWDSANGYEYVANANNSSVSVIGTPSVPPYPVTFDETGLAAGTSWTVTLAGALNTTTGASNDFKEINGSYSYSVTPIAGYVASALSGSVLVDGYPVHVAITFTEVVYAVTFTETGLPSGALWTVDLNGSAAQSANPNVIFTLPNGSYSYSIPTVSGYTSTPGSGWANVTGSGPMVTITFSKVSTSSSGTSSVGGVPLWEIAVIVVAIASVVTGILLGMRRSKPPASTTTPPPPPGNPGGPS
jgi:YVTN family beta-propeller protein